MMRYQEQQVQRGRQIHMARRVKGEEQNVVERAIAHCDGSPSSLASQLSKLAGTEVTRQRVHGWRLRSVFPRDMIVHVENLTGISIEELASARPKERDHGNVVNRAIRLLGADSTASDLAEELTKISGRKITRQMVNGWQASEQFPVDISPYVHLLTRIPVRELIIPRKKRKG